MASIKNPQHSIANKPLKGKRKRPAKKTNNICTRNSSGHFYAINKKSTTFNKEQTVEVSDTTAAE